MGCSVGKEIKKVVFCGHKSGTLWDKKRCTVGQKTVHCGTKKSCTGGKNDRSPFKKNVSVVETENELKLFVMEV